MYLLYCGPKTRTSLRSATWTMDMAVVIISKCVYLLYWGPKMRTSLRSATWMMDMAVVIISKCVPAVLGP